MAELAQLWKQLPDTANMGGELQGQQKITV
jgi:hypothetical protein